MAKYRGYEGDTPHKAREAYARGVGYRSYRDMKSRRAEHRPRAGDVLARPTAVTRTAGEAGRVTKAARGADVRRAVQAAADAGDRVSLIITMDAGAGPRTHRIDKWTGAAEPGDRVRKGDGGVSGGDASRVGSVQVVAGPAVAAGGGGGIDPNTLLDFFDMYDDPWDGLYDLWDEEYP